MTSAYRKIKPSSDVIKRHLDSAKERISSATLLLKDNKNRDAVSRAYYGFFDAASALF